MSYRVLTLHVSVLYFVLSTKQKIKTTIFRRYANGGLRQNKFVTDRRLIRRFPTVFQGVRVFSVSGG